MGDGSRLVTRDQFEHAIRRALLQRGLVAPDLLRARLPMVPGVDERVQRAASAWIGT